MREARRAFRRVACAMTRASACGSSWLSVESRRVALATIATPSRADAPRRRPVAAVRHATAAEAPATHWAGRQKARAALASATRLMSESDRASFAADADVEFVVEISRCRAPLHRSTTQAPRPAADVELYSSTALQSALHLYSSTALYTLHPLHPPSVLHETFGGGFSPTRRSQAAPPLARKVARGSVDRTAYSPKYSLSFMSHHAERISLSVVRGVNRPIRSHLAKLATLSARLARA